MKLSNYEQCKGLQKEGNALEKLLIANRGEVASRIIRTCQRLNIASVAVYSDADKELPYVKEADEAFPLGEAHPQKSYMNIERLLEVAKECEADGIHPGYGFLSENADFVREVESAGMTFIGPEANVVELMGDKVKARDTMKAAKVPVVPGSESALDNLNAALEQADDIGYPVMLKASAGGGGIGMQLCHTPEQLKQAFQSNQGRAKAYFGSFPHISQYRQPLLLLTDLSIV